MGRILFFLLLAVVIYLLWRALQRRDGAADRRTERQTDQRDDGAAHPMVSCATCGLHLPRQDALALGERFYCCEEHRRHPPAG